METTMIRPAGVDEDDFIRMNKREFSTVVIEWTPKKGGWARVKENHDVCFIYTKCMARDAEIAGWVIIEQKRRGMQFHLRATAN